MRISKTLVFLFGFAALLVLGVQGAAAQTATTGDLTGVVTDPVNAIVPSAKIQLRNLEQGTTRETKTNGAGIYRFSLLPANTK